MANTQIDVAKKLDLNDVTASAAGTVTNDVRVVLKQGITKEEASVTLKAIADALVGDSITLQ